MTLLSRFLGQSVQDREDPSGTLLAPFEWPEGPVIKDIVDISLDTQVEPLVTMVEGNDLEEARSRGLSRTGRLVNPPVGTGGLLVWRPGEGLQQAPITVVRVSWAHPSQWALRFTGAATKCQRRTFVRADVFLPVALTVSDERVAVTGVDLSEGGLCCASPRRSSRTPRTR